MHFPLRTIAALVPLALTPVIFWLLADGYVNLGGGEKDIIAVFPWALWSIFYAVAFAVATRRRHKFGATLLRAVGWATGLILLMWIILYLTLSDWLGISGSQPADL